MLTKDQFKPKCLPIDDINDYQNNKIMPHEKILVHKGKERAEQLKKVRYQICPIYLFFDDSKLKIDLKRKING